MPNVACRFSSTATALAQFLKRESAEILQHDSWTLHGSVDAILESYVLRAPSRPTARLNYRAICKCRESKIHIERQCYELNQMIGINKKKINLE